MSDDLVERLRGFPQGVRYELRLAAADRIEELEAENARLRSQLDAALEFSAMMEMQLEAALQETD